MIHSFLPLGEAAVNWTLANPDRLVAVTAADSILVLMEEDCACTVGETPLTQFTSRRLIVVLKSLLNDDVVVATRRRAV